MAAIVNTNLAGFTVDYNGIQFGGADAPYSSYPPSYDFVADEVWDETHRTIKSIRFTLQVSCVFFANSEATMASNMRAIRAALIIPGKTLKLSGLGSGFDWINPAVINLTGDIKDVGGGPFPMPLKMNPIGQLAYEVIWGIQWEQGCAANPDPLWFMSFAFSTTWRNDFEGMTTRIIQGKVSIPFVRNPASVKTMTNVAEETRGSILIRVPTGFKRVENTWSEGADKRTLDFTIVDQQLEGDPYPAGIVQADGSFSLNFGSGSASANPMNKAIATLNCSFKTAVNQPKNLAGQIFIAMMLAKQADIMDQMRALKVATPSLPDYQVLPIGFAIQNGKFDSARITQASVSWILLQDFSSILTASKLFDQLPGTTQDYPTWRASIQALWGNRGTSLIGTNKNPVNGDDAVIIDLCDQRYSATIGATNDTIITNVPATIDPITCPTVPDDGGWIHFDLKIELLTQDSTSLHKKAAAYTPSQNYGTFSTDNSVSNTGGPIYSQSNSDQDVVEYHGYPTITVGLAFSGLRFVHVPEIPRIKSVGGASAIQIEAKTPAAVRVMDSFGCPVWSISGYRVYSVPGGNISQLQSLQGLRAANTKDPYVL